MTRAQAIGITRKRYVQACEQHDMATAHRMALVLARLRDKSFKYERSSDS